MKTWLIKMFIQIQNLVDPDLQFSCQRDLWPLISKPGRSRPSGLILKVFTAFDFKTCYYSSKVIVSSGKYVSIILFVAR